LTVRGEVLRSQFGPLGTPGRMRLDNSFECDTLEKNWHDNKNGISCTMADTYHGRVVYSDHFKRNVIRFDDKNGRVACEIHHGNFAADEQDLDNDGLAEITSVHGCTLVGHNFGLIQRKDGKQQYGIRNSVAALDALLKSLEDSMQAGGYHDVVITYRWAEGCAP
jgi:hypothetical protein